MSEWGVSDKAIDAAINALSPSAISRREIGIALNAAAPIIEEAASQSFRDQVSRLQAEVKRLSAMVRL